VADAGIQHWMYINISELNNHPSYRFMKIKGTCYCRNNSSIQSAFCSLQYWCAGTSYSWFGFHCDSSPRRFQINNLQSFLCLKLNK
jgi:hypothetical protein